MGEDKSRHSVAGKRRIVTVAPSPFNAVKFELGVLLLLAIPVWLLVVKQVSGDGRQLLYLLAYGGLAALWLVVRIRFVMAAEVKSGKDKDGA
jgi:hypothetical protein